MLFSKPVLEAIARGEVRLAFRRWRKPTVRAGGTLTTAIGLLGIETVEPVNDLSEAEARAAGAASRAALLAGLRAEGQLYRIAFRVAGPDPRLALRQRAEGWPDAVSALARMDAPVAWTRATLRLIADHPGTRAADLAAQLGLDTPRFKARVRRLKAIGLTESLDIGYRLSRRGSTVLARLESGAAADPAAHPVT